MQEIVKKFKGSAFNCVGCFIEHCFSPPQALLISSSLHLALYRRSISFVCLLLFLAYASISFRVIPFLPISHGWPTVK
jgi:hypothetical protein